MVSFKKLSVAAAAVAGVQAQNSSQSICDKYTVALLTNNTAANQYTLLTLLVKTAVIGNFTGPGTKLTMLPGSMVNVPGILAKGTVNGTEVNLLPYFTGAYKSSNRGDTPTSVNFLDLNTTTAVTNATYIGNSTSNAYKLLTHLNEYFGAALGCTTYGSDGFPAYAGALSMTNVHKFMAISNAENTYFIQQVGLAAKSFGASDADVATVGNLLLTTFNQRCSPASQVIPSQPAQLNAICLDTASCPTATNANCSAYPTGIYTAFAQIQTSPAMGGNMSASTTTTGTRTGSMTGTMTGSMTSPTNGGAVATGMSGALAVMAGVAALVL